MANQKASPATTQETETAIAPGGPRPRSSTSPIHPGEAVQQNATGAFEVVTAAQNMKTDGTPATATDLVLTPGGYRTSSLVHYVEHGVVIDSAQNHLKMLGPNNAVLADLGQLVLKPVGRPLMPFEVTLHPAVVPALGSGWIVYASWTENSKPLTLFTTTWTVPPPPATQSGQTIFLFNGIQNSTMIYQPVLQWGPSAAGGGNYWSVASWYADGQGGQAFYTSLVRVNPGQVLVGVMTETGQSASGFNYNCQFSGIANTSLPIQNVQQLTWCVETLECYGLQKCSDYPQTCRTSMSAIEIEVASGPVAPAWAATNSVTDCGQHAVVVSNASPGGEVDLYYNNSSVSVFNGKVTLGDTSPRSPSLASLDGRLYIAWKGDGNDNLNVMCSADSGITFGGKFTSPETSPQGPGLCVHNDNLYITWKGDGNDNLNVARVNLSGNSVTGFSNKVTLGDTSPVSPSIASLNGRLYIAWKGDGNDNLNVMYSTDNGATFGNKYTSPETSPQAPGLCVHNGNLYITWKGDGNDNLNIAQVNISGNSITGFVGKVTLPDTSPVSPTLASNNGKLYLGWKGDGNNNLNVENSSNNGASFGSKYTSPETSPQAPALCTHNGKVYIGWMGDGNDNLNVAQLCG
ncbi:MAG: sialidase family protein [Acidobacteriaceae bacterium]